MRWLLLLPALLLFAPACDESSPENTSDESGREKKKRKNKRATKSSAAPNNSTASPAPAPVTKTEFTDWKFVRQQTATDAKGADACAYLGGLGMACLDALLAEKDPTIKSYMRLLSDADARLAKAALERGAPQGVAHAEASMFCADSGPCKQLSESGDPMDDGYSCLTKAEIALQEGDGPGAKKVHARACQCDPVRAQIPVMGGMLACDGKDKPATRGEALTEAQAKGVRACATCDAASGPAACAAQIDSTTDSKLKAYLVDAHVPRCQKP